MDERESEGPLYVQGNRDRIERRDRKEHRRAVQHFSLKLSQRGEGPGYKKRELNVFRMRFQWTALPCKRVKGPLGSKGGSHLSRD